MASYIGKQPLVGNYTVLDSLTATTTDTYALTKNSVAVFPQTPANCIVSLNGVIQAPFDSYTISGSNIVFASALTASDSIDFITVLGDVLNVGTVSDGTIGLAKLSATGTKDATTFLRGDNTFATAGASAGQVIQVVSNNHTSQASTTSTSFVDLSANTNLSMTCSSTANKVLIIAHFNECYFSGSHCMWIRITAGGTEIIKSECVLLVPSTGERLSNQTITFPYSPNSTSSIEYKMQFRSSNGSSVIINQNSSAGGSNLILMEVKG